MARRAAGRLTSSQLHAGENVFHHAADVGDYGQVEAIVKAVNKAFGSIDILVNNAGLNLKKLPAN